MIELTACLLLVVPGTLIALRWLFEDRREARAHELELHTRRVTLDQAEVDKALALVKKLEERVKTLEYRKS